MEEETKKRIENVEDNLDKVMLENRELDNRVIKLEEINEKEDKKHGWKSNCWRKIETT